MTDREISQYVYHFNTKVAEVLGKSPMNISVELGNAVRTAGTCYKTSPKSRNAVIGISRVLAGVRSIEETKNTIVHELCHAYNEKDDCHGAGWKQVAQKVGSALGYNITRTYRLTNEQRQDLTTKVQVTKKPIGIIEVPEIGYRKYIYKKCRGYHDEYKDWFIRKDGQKYNIVFTKLA